MFCTPDKKFLILPGYPIQGKIIVTYAIVKVSSIDLMTSLDATVNVLTIWWTSEIEVTLKTSTFRNERCAREKESIMCEIERSVPRITVWQAS